MQKSGHGRGHSRSEGPDLGMNAGEKGVGGPTAEFHDGGVWLALEFESHGSQGPQAVRANPAEVKVALSNCCSVINVAGVINPFPTRTQQDSTEQTNASFTKEKIVSFRSVAKGLLSRNQLSKPIIFFAQDAVLIIRQCGRNRHAGRTVLK